MQKILLACLLLMTGNAVLADSELADSAANKSGLDKPGPVESVLTPVNAEMLHDYLQAVQKDGNTVVLVNFWATWCAPCREEIPIFLELEEKLGGQDFRLVAVSLDEAESIDTVVHPFMTRWFPGFTSLYSVEYEMDDIVSVVDNAWNEVLPTSYLYSRDGTLSERLQGKYTAAEFESRIVTLLQD